MIIVQKTTIWMADRSKYIKSKKSPATKLQRPYIINYLLSFKFPIISNPINRELPLPHKNLESVFFFSFFL